MLFAIYIGCLILGGGLLGASFFTDHDTDHDLDLDADADFDVDADADLDADHDVDMASSIGVADALWLPFLSLRFWLFFVAFFGLTGTLLSGLSLAGQNLGLGVSLGMGFLCGYTASRLVQALRKERVSSEVDPRRDYVGKRGIVLLDVTPDEPGQVRVEAKGSSVDLPAEVQDGSVLTRGSEVIVLGYENGSLRVARFDTGERGRQQVSA